MSKQTANDIIDPPRFGDGVVGDRAGGQVQPETPKLKQASDS